MKIIFKLIILVSFPAILFPQESIVDTKHNLSVTGPGTVIAEAEYEICLFCHTAHNSRPNSPLWNRNDPGSTYVLYKSSTMKAAPGQPSGSSILCLSCHDGTIALGSVLSRQSTITFANFVVNMPVGPSNLSTDLRNDHPISFTYDVALAGLKVGEASQLVDPADLPSTIKLENNKLQCTSCHDPHKNTYSDFLVATSQKSELCISCHTVPNWTASIHSTSTKTWNTVAPNPWPYSPWTTVEDNACDNCHNPHNAGDTTRLLKYLPEENNCLDCHNGNVAATNIKSEFDKTYRHNLSGYTAKHDPTEAGIPAVKHVECNDCHNPHAAKIQTANAPAVKGANFSVVGINQSAGVVNPATNEYEICYRCHSGSSVTNPGTTRKIVQNDLRLELDATNPSYHPVVAAGVNTTIADLISPLTSTSKIYCTDCHSSNDTAATTGPHGSIYPHILKFNYDTSDAYSAEKFRFELCYNCHDQPTVIAKHNTLNASTLSDHGTITSCNLCHDPHGISGTQGNTTNNLFLINFNTARVTNNSAAALNWTYTSPGHGNCNLKCHTHDHVNSTY